MPSDAHENAAHSSAISSSKAYFFEPCVPVALAAKQDCRSRPPLPHPEERKCPNHTPAIPEEQLPDARKQQLGGR
jgi:hypothetical protein